MQLNSNTKNMNLHAKYNEESGGYNPSITFGFGVSFFTEEYVHWLERKIEKMAPFAYLEILSGEDLAEWMFEGERKIFKGTWMKNEKGSRTMYSDGNFFFEFRNRANIIFMDSKNKVHSIKSIKDLFAVASIFRELIEVKNISLI